jgi:hypothetical protein
VFAGNAEVIGVDPQYKVEAGQSVRLSGLDHPQINSFPVPDPDDFDNWALDRDQEESPVASATNTATRGGGSAQGKDEPTAEPSDSNHEDAGKDTSRYISRRCPTPWCEWDAYPEIWAMVLAGSLALPQNLPPNTFPSSGTPNGVLPSNRITVQPPRTSEGQAELTPSKARQPIRTQRTTATSATELANRRPEKPSSVPITDRHQPPPSTSHREAAPSLPKH